MIKLRWILIDFILLLIFIFSLIGYYQLSIGTEFFGYLKPATIFQFSLLLLFMCLIETFSKELTKLININKSFFIILCFFLLMGTFFEMMWAFNYWFTVQGVINVKEVDKAITLDTIGYEPTNEMIYDAMGDYKDKNLNFSAKKNTCYFFMALYLLMFVWRGENIGKN